MIATMMLAAAVASATPGAGEVTAYPPSFFADARPSTAMDMIDRLPGFSFDGGSGVRGLSGSEGNVLIDGEHPVSKSDYLGDQLARIPASQVERIDVIRGGAPGIDMAGKAIVANVIRKPQESLTGSATLKAGGVARTGRTAAYGDLTGAYKSGPSSATAEVNYTDQDPNDTVDYIRRRIDANGDVILDSQTYTHAASQDFEASLTGERPLWGGTAQGNLKYSKDSDASVDREYFLTPGAPRIQPNKSDNQNGEAGFNYSHPINATLGLELVGLATQRTNQSTSISTSNGVVSANQGDQTSGERTGRFTLHWKPRTALSVDAGAEGAYNFLDGSSTLTVNGVTTPILGSAADVEEKRGEGFAVATWRARPNLTLEAAAREEVSRLSTTGKEKDLSFFKPSLQATWQITPATQLRVRAQRTVDQLDFGQFLASVQLDSGQITAGATDLVPTQDNQIYARLEHSFWDKGLFSVQVTRDWYDDIIDVTPVTAGGSTFDGNGNIGRGEQASLNTSLDLPLTRLGLKGGRLSLYENWNFQQSVTDPTTGEKRRFSNSGRYSWGADYTQDVSRWKTTFGLSLYVQDGQTSWRYEGRNFYNRGPSLSGYIDYRPSAAWSLRADFGNLFRKETSNLRQVYAGQRDITPLLYDEYTKHHDLPTLIVTLRRTF